MTMLAVDRPDAWNFPLFLHVLGSMVLVGAVTLAAVTLIAVWRGGSESMFKLAFRTLLYAGLPGYIVMRIGAEWIADKEGLNADDVDVSWIDIGYMASDPGLLFLIVAAVLVNIRSRRAQRGGESSETLTRVAGVLTSLTLVGLLVAVWAMTTKPV